MIGAHVESLYITVCMEDGHFFATIPIFKHYVMIALALVALVSCFYKALFLVPGSKKPQCNEKRTGDFFLLFC